jgi:uncharacterized delta-60 repeat protein
MKNLTARIVFCLTIFLTLQVTTTAHAAGVVDRSFATNGTATTAVGSFLQIRDLESQPDGKLLVLGTVGSGETQNTLLVRYLANGALDTDFGNNGISVTALSPLFETATDMVLQSDGRIIVVGNMYSPVTQSIDFLVARFNQKGKLDLAFGENGIKTVNQGSLDIFNKVALRSNGQIVAAGNTSDGGNVGAVIVFNPNGALATDFGDSGLFYYSYNSRIDAFFQAFNGFQDVEVLADNRILVGGTNYTFGTERTLVGYHLLRLTASGSVDTTFADQGTIVATEFGNALTNKMDFEILPDGKIFVVDKTGVRIINGDGSPHKSFAFDGHRVVKYPNGKFLVSGGSLGNVKLYSDRVFIGKSAGIPGELAAAQTDGKIVVANVVNNSLVINRLSRVTSQATRMADFDNDDKTDLFVNRPSTNTAWILKSTGGFLEHTMRVASDKKIIPEYYERDIPLDGVIYRNNLLYFHNTPTVAFEIEVFGSSFANSAEFPGLAFGDIPVGGDFNGDGLTEKNVFKPFTGTWLSAYAATTSFQWGINGDMPVPADYDYDGITDYAVYRPGTGTWWVHNSSNGSHFAFNFGIASDIPLTGDYDGDGRADFTVYRPGEGNWYQYLTTEGFRVVRFGLPTDIPVPGDYDGDGRHDIAVFREGVWYLLQSTAGFGVANWGIATDIPVAVRYDQ